MRTYWKLSPSNFGNEYSIGVASTDADAEQYKAEGYQRIDRDYALSCMARRPVAGEQLSISVSNDGDQVQDRFQLARQLRKRAA